MGAADHYDVIVVGSGPGGASLAHRLAGTGKRILMLERGSYLPRSSDNWNFKGRLCRCHLFAAHRLSAHGPHPASPYWTGNHVSKPRK